MVAFRVMIWIIKINLNFVYTLDIFFPRYAGAIDSQLQMWKISPEVFTTLFLLSEHFYCWKSFNSFEKFVEHEVTSTWWMNNGTVFCHRFTRNVQEDDNFTTETTGKKR